MIRLVAGAATDVGRARLVNEDSFLVAEGLFAVADGMGGHQAGDVASHEALEAMRQAIVEPSTEDLIAAVQTANTAVFQRSVTDLDLAGMGTTLCAVGLMSAGEPAQVAVVNVGDSRVYLHHDDEFLQVSEDHSLVETMVREGSLSPDEAASHPRRNVVTRALGIDSAVDVDAWEVAIVAGDRLLLCSDGLVNEMQDDQISAVLRRLADPSEAAAELVRLANDAGGRDNITVLIVDAVGDDDGDGAPIGSRVLRITAPEVGLGAAVGAAQLRPDQLTDDQLEAGELDTDANDEMPSPGPKARRREGRWRTLVFVLALLAVFGMAFAAIAYTARSTYFVGNDRGRVVVFQGRNGSLLWFDPTIEERTEIRMGQLTDAQVEIVDANREVGSIAAARRIIDNLREAVTTTTTTTTTAPTTMAPTTTLVATTVPAPADLTVPPASPTPGTP